MIDKVSCLCLDKRKELWLELEKQVNTILQLPMEKFICGDGQDDSLEYSMINQPVKHMPFLYILNKSHYNAFLSHKAICEKALNEGVNTLLMLEDDAYLTERFNYIFNSTEIQNHLLNIYWDMIYLGWWMRTPGTEDIDRTDLETEWNNNGKYGISTIPIPTEVSHRISGLHGILLNKKMIHEIAHANIGPIDAFLNRRLHLYKGYFIYPKIIHTKSCFSYCEGSYFNRMKL